jgi:Ser/Thr protein kinase RdoA (MazF antagonist)
MLPVSELVRVVGDLDADGSSPLALEAARAWGYEQVRFVRSSANHVFVCEGRDRDGGVVRMGPGPEGHAGIVAQTARRLALAGAPVAPAVESLDGRLTVVVPDSPRPYVATMVAEVSGQQLDEDSLTDEAARSWGRALARFHEVGTQLDPPAAAPAWLDLVAAASESAGGRGIVESLQRLPVYDGQVGLVHGDPELDNVIWDAGEATFVDVDGLSRSWFGADICFALRNIAVPEPFIEGYPELRPLTDEELAWVPLFRRGHDLITLAALERIAEPDEDDWPLWAKELNARLREIVERLRRSVGD